MVAVADDQVAMRVVRVGSGLVDRREPRCPSSCDPIGERPHELAALRLVQLARQGKGDLVDDPCVLPVGLLLPVQPCAGRVAFRWHVRRHDNRLRALPRDVADVRPCGSLRVGAAADAAHVQAVDGDFGPAPPHPADKSGTEKPSGFACSHEGRGRVCPRLFLGEALKTHLAALLG